MNNLINVLRQNGQLVVSSREIADNFKKEHSSVVVRAIENIINDLQGSGQNCTHLFIENKYQHSQNKQWYKEYLLTRDGFSLLVMGFTGSEALQWKLKYIDAFNKMELALKNPYKGLSKELQAIFTVDQKTQALEERVDKLEDTMVIDYAEQQFLNTHARAKVLAVLGGRKSKAYKEVSKIIFCEIWRDYKKHFQVNSYKNTPKAKYRQAIEYISNWQPCTNNQLEIKHFNNSL